MGSVDRPHNRAVASHNRAGSLRLFLCAFAMGFGVSIGHGQWLETKITLPDSLGGATGPTCLTTDSSERYVYIGDAGGSVYIVDAEARLRVSKIPANSYVTAVCTNTRQNKVYALAPEANQVLVISCATNQVVTTVPTGAKPLALCYNSNGDKIYVANYDSDDLTVIDCSSDSVIKTIHLGESPAGLCYNPASNRVFCASETLWAGHALMVIDGANDSVVAVYAGTWNGPMMVNAVANRVYASRGTGLLALDGTTGVVLDSMQASAAVMCLNSRTQKLYSVDARSATGYVFDCTADTLVGLLRPLHVEDVFSIVCDTVVDRVYATCYSSLSPRDVILVIDGVTDTIAARIPGPHWGELLVSSRRGRVYSTDLYGPELAVFDTGTDSLLCTIMIGGSSNLMCYDSTDDKVYYVSWSVLGEASAIDAATNQPVAHIPVGRYPSSVVWHAPTNRVYCGGSRDITVIDPRADTVTKVLAVIGDWLCSAPGVNKVYAFSGQNEELAVIGCRNDSVVKTIPIPAWNVPSMCYVAYDKLYISGYDNVSIVDCIGDTLIRTYPFGYNRLVAGRDGKRVHCASTNALRTFDPAGDTLVADVPWEAYGLWALLYAPGVDKVYCACPADGQNCILVADAATDSLIAEIPLLLPWALGYDSISGLVYCSQASDSAVTFIDSRTDSIVGSLNAGICPERFVMVPAHSRVYVGGWGNSFIPVIRTDPPGVEEAAQPIALKKPAIPAIMSKNTPFVVHQPSVLLDAVGRKVLYIKPGLHRLTGCRAGVYFLRDRPDGKTMKILLVD